MAFSDSLDIECSIQNNDWTNHGNIDECIVFNVKVKNPHEPIESVTIEKNDYIDPDEMTTVATPEENAKDKILSFYIRRSPSCLYVPSGIAENFKNIKILVIAYTGLKVITQADLKPLQKIQNLYIDNNKLTSLDDDLFVFNPTIEYINLSYNQIKSMGPMTFEPLSGLKELGLSRNVCIDEAAKGIENVDALKLKLKTKCLYVEENVVQHSD